jgi:hypothetical protein
MDELTYQAENAYRNDADGMPIPFKKAWPVLVVIVISSALIAYTGVIYRRVKRTLADRYTIKSKMP